MENYGILIEKEIVEYLHGKKINELNNYWKTNIAKIFLSYDGDDYIFAKRIARRSKVDIEIRINSSVKYIGIKSGEHNSFHGEDVFKFVNFLAEIGISRRTLKILLFYHFGDGSLDGSGKIRLSAEELKIKYGKFIEEANNELNQPQVIEKVVRRVVLQGTNKNERIIDYLYYGDVNFGYIISREDIIRYIKYHKYGMIKGLHFGPLNYQPYKRKLSTNNNSKERYISQIKWISLFSDIQKIYRMNK